MNRTGDLAAWRRWQASRHRLRRLRRQSFRQRGDGLLRDAVAAEAPREVALLGRRPKVPARGKRCGQLRHPLGSIETLGLKAKLLEDGQLLARAAACVQEPKR